MLNLRTNVQRLSKLRIPPHFRLLSTEVQEEDLSSLSVRQKSWLQAQERYKKYENVLYSSFVEMQEDTMSYDLKRSLLKKINMQLKRQEKEREYWGKNVKPVPNDWMDEYEYYSGGQEAESGDNEKNKLGTADPVWKPSNVPCNGCGALLHCNHHNRPGFLPAEIFKGRKVDELKTITCQRCHFLKHYSIALDLEVTPEFYIDTIARIKDEHALAILMVDLLDFPCSIWPGMHELLGPKRPIFIVGNKVDLLPRDSRSYLDHVKKCLMEQIVKSGFNKLNVKNISLISAKTGYGIEELITQLQKQWGYKGNVYLMGCTNVGKSSLFNILLNSDYCRPEATNLIAKATTCPWPGTTLQMLKFPIHRPTDIRVFQRFKRLKTESFHKAEIEKLRLESGKKYGNTSDIVPVGHVGRTFGVPVDQDIMDGFAISAGTQAITTLNERSKEYQKARWVYDTPGVMHPDQITTLLTPQELADLQPKQMISPRAYRLKPGMSLFVAGLARLDFIDSNCKDLEYLHVFLFASFNLPTLISNSDKADEVYQKYLNTPLLQIPSGDDQRLSQWSGLQCHPKEFRIKGYMLKSKFCELNCSGDITLSSAGWVGLRIPVDVECSLKVWTPNAKGIYFRQTSLVPYAERLIGKRIRNSLAYNTGKPFTFKK